MFDLDYSNFDINFNTFLQIQTNLYSIFTILEILLFKYWMKFIRKRVMAMNDEIIVFYLTLQNLCISAIYAFVKITIGDGAPWNRSLLTSRNVKFKSDTEP